jgi:hypothetical protein
MDETLCHRGAERLTLEVVDDRDRGHTGWQLRDVEGTRSPGRGAPNDVDEITTIKGGHLHRDLVPTVVLHGMVRATGTDRPTGRRVPPESLGSGMPPIDRNLVVHQLFARISNFSVRSGRRTCTSDRFSALRPGQSTIVSPAARALEAEPGRCATEEGGAAGQLRAPGPEEPASHAERG